MCIRKRSGGHHASTHHHRHPNGTNPPHVEIMPLCDPVSDPVSKNTSQNSPSIFCELSAPTRFRLRSFVCSFFCSSFLLHASFVFRVPSPAALLLLLTMTHDARCTMHDADTRYSPNLFASSSVNLPRLELESIQTKPYKDEPCGSLFECVPECALATARRCHRRRKQPSCFFFPPVQYSAGCISGFTSYKWIQTHAWSTTLSVAVGTSERERPCACI
jgi:hypothetical protein